MAVSLLADLFTTEFYEISSPFRFVIAAIPLAISWEEKDAIKGKYSCLFSVIGAAVPGAADAYELFWRCRIWGFPHSQRFIRS